ncbi:MAG: glycosyltransferase family 4 protein, partial [bacterium]|nr:glycosyltransferase family 4 protein [bacterium]
MNADLKNSSSLSQGPIHLVTDQFNIGGGIEHIYQIAAGMKNFKFRIFALPGKGDALEKFNGLDNVEIHGNGFKPDQLLEGNPRLIHFHHLRPLLSFFKTPFTRSPVPMVFTAHGLHIHKYEFTHNIRARVNYILRFHLEKRLFAKVDRVIAVSREDKAFIETNYKVNNVLYLTNGIDFKGADSGPVPSKQKLRRELDLPRDEFLFVTVARFNFQKGYDILIKGIAKA